MKTKLMIGNVTKNKKVFVKLKKGEEEKKICAKNEKIYISM